MQATGSPTVRRRELGALLKALRNGKGWTAEQVADRMLISTSKLSRLETGQRGASARDVRDLCDLYEVDDEQRQHLLELAREGKQRAWWQPLALPYVEIYELTFRTLMHLAASPEATRDIITAMIPNYRARASDGRRQG